jgi:Virulence factor membrane-bound polymerase, C-terminal/O-Antigen ligase
VSGVQAVKPRSAQADAVSLMLAGGLCLLPFLLPYHQPPILSFQAEWLSAAIGIAAMLAALMRWRDSTFVAVPLPARCLIAFALFLAAQALAGNPVYPQLPLLGALYVLYAALLIWLGAHLTAAAGIERAADVLAACLLAGAVANAAAGVIQFYGLPALLEDIVAKLGHGPDHNAAVGNIAQANLYANYLALGGTALLFLWLRGGLRTAYALAAGVMLAWASALSGSRGALLYALWFAMLGLLAGRMQAGAGARRLKFAAVGLAGAMLAAQAAIPWLNDSLELGPASQGAFERLVAISSEHREARWPAWQLGLRVFADAPIAGAGWREFAGAAFKLGIAPEMTNGEVWSSPHNLPLHLLAETGAVGAALALAGLVIWCWRAGRRYFLAPQPALWWIIAAVGIELIHSMFEFPLWNAHFLGVTALLMGLGTVPGACSKAASRLSRTTAAGICAALTLALALLLRDYMRLDATRITGTSITLASAADTARDAAVMHALTRGPLAPMAELWIFLGAPLDRGDLAARLKMSERLARYFPSNAVIVRRAVFLAFDGQAAAARRLLLHAMTSFPHRCKATVLILEQALASDRVAMEPLLALAKDAARSRCN